MENKNEFIMLQRVFAALAFLLVFVMLALNVQPSVPFWDCGEFLTAATWQQVPHPPGSPLFLLLGRLFQIIIPFGDLGWRGNMLSVTASSVVIYLMYLIVVMVIKNFRTEKITTMGDALAVYGAAFVGTIAFGFTGTFWFNAVESETYNTALLGMTIVIYLMMRWTQVADEPGNEKYILLSMYVIGLSMGLHQPSLLVIFTMILIIYFRKYEVTTKTFLCLAAFGLISFYIVYFGVALSIPAFLAGRTATRNEAYEYAIQDNAALKYVAIIGIALVGYLFYWAVKKKKPMIAITSFSMLVVTFSFLTPYAHVLIRSNANPPMNENEPKNFNVLASYLGREQYGSAPMWPRRYQTDDYYVREHTRRDGSGNYVYGEWNPPKRKRIQRKDGSQIEGNDWSNANTAGELAYLWKYQMNHMYFRYFFWNFVGRESDAQDAGTSLFDKRDTAEFNYKSGYAHLFPLQFFALPFIFGLFGLYYHFKRDPKMALVYLATFLVLGILTAIYQNQQNPQPRERDYFYVGSFLIWGVWIGMGVYGLIDLLSRKKEKTIAISAIVLAISVVMVPVNLAANGLKAYGRAGNYIPFDYAYNLLQSVEENAIIFTNGDNDTFPVWYVQDVAGVRRDVRICNLSLGNTLWYVDELKNRQPWGAEKVPLSFSDDSLHVSDEADPRALSYDFGEALNLSIPVKKEILAKYTNDPNILNAGNITFTVFGKLYPNRKSDKNKPLYLYRVQDKLVIDIIKQTKFERPVYFSTSVGGDNFCGFSPYFKQEGLCMRICPVVQEQDGEQAYNEPIMDKILLNVNNSNDYSKTKQYGLKLRNLNNPSVYFDHVHRETMSVYRRVYVSYADYLVRKKDFVKAKQICDAMRKNISETQFPMPFEMEHRMAYIYEQVGDKENTERYAKMTIKSCEEVMNNDNLRPDMVYYEQLGRVYGPYQIATQMYKMLGNYDAAYHTLEKLLKTVSSIKSQIIEAGETNTEEFRYIMQNEANIKVGISQTKIDDLVNKGDLNAALDTARAIHAQMRADTTDPMNRYFIGAISARIKELEIKLGISSPIGDELTLLQ